MTEETLWKDILKELQKEIYFPYSKVRDVQADMISDVYDAIKNKKKSTKGNSLFTKKIKQSE